MSNNDFGFKMIQTATIWDPKKPMEKLGSKISPSDDVGTPPEGSLYQACGTPGPFGAPFSHQKAHRPPPVPIWMDSKHMKGKKDEKDEENHRISLNSPDGNTSSRIHHPPDAEIPVCRLQHLRRKMQRVPPQKSTSCIGWLGILTKMMIGLLWL